MQSNPIQQIKTQNTNQQSILYYDRKFWWIMYIYSFDNFYNIIIETTFSPIYLIKYRRF
jgi:hypothetical protein